jgi:YD repeat-containing protein
LYYHNTKLNGKPYPRENITITQEPMTIEWTPKKDEIGELVVGFGVNHLYGWSGDGTVTFNVINRDFDVTSTPHTHARVGVPYQYQITVNDLDKQTLSYELLSAPSGMQIGQNGLITWTPESEGLASIKLQVSDGGFIHGQIFDVMVQPQNAKLTSTFIIEKRVLDVGESVTANLAYQNALGDITETLTLDGQALSISDDGVANITLENSGIYTLDYTVKDQFETLTKSITIYAKDTSDVTAPVASIINPTNANDIYAPTSVIATIEDEQLIYWQLLMRKGNNANDEIIAEGDAQPIVSQAIAEIDPTMMINGLYTLTLIAVDLGGNESYDQVNVAISGNLKVGNMSFTTQDLSIPLSGIPITVNRSYDSRRRAHESDMGFGWKVEYQDIEIDESMEPTQGWYQYASRSKFDIGGGAVVSPSTCIAPLGEKKIVISLPDGTQEKFNASAHALDGGIESISHPGCYFTAGRRYSLAFNALNSTTSKLELGSGINNSFYLTDLTNGHLAADIIDFTFAPISAYTLTTKQGYQYQLDQNFGIQTVIDPNGHQLTYTENGIQHSNGKGITFDRDAQGRITSITDPSGNTVMAYEYDSVGNLRFAKDATAIEQSSNGVEYTYTLDHNIIDIIDHLGAQWLKTFMTMMAA